MYWSTPRPKQRGGGSAITCSSKEYSMKEIKVDNPDNLEVTIALIKSKDPKAKNLSIMTFAIYCPPKSKKKTKLLLFLSLTYQI